MIRSGVDEKAPLAPKVVCEPFQCRAICNATHLPALLLIRTFILLSWGLNRPRGHQTCCVNPVQATVTWIKDFHSVSFEVRPPASANSGVVAGCIDFYIGAVPVGQAHVEMAVVQSNHRAEEPDILSPVTKVNL